MIDIDPPLPPPHFSFPLKKKKKEDRRRSIYVCLFFSNSTRKTILNISLLQELNITLLNILLYDLRGDDYYYLFI